MSGPDFMTFHPGAVKIKVVDRLLGTAIPRKKVIICNLILKILFVLSQDWNYYSMI